LWDGQTLNGWDGESDVWSIDNGAIHADTTKTPGQHHLHYKGPNAVMKDFDLKVEFKISASGANGGIQYRSRLLMAPHKGSIQNPLGSPLPSGITTFAAAVQAGAAERAPARQGGGGRGGQAADGRQSAPAGAAPPPPPTLVYQNPWQVSGYQFDLDSDNRYTGQLYEGQGRGIVNPPGGMVELVAGKQNRIGTVNPKPVAAVKPHDGLQGEWQQVQIIARGNTLVHVLNGQVISFTIDDDPASRAPQGILSLQLEGSGQIWYRNVYVRHLD
jgi:3-keto-disaccharide hydrolase